jgi:hypothetical protein
MPSLPETPLAEQIRAAKPRAPEELRVRILALPEPEPEQPRRRLWGRRALLVLAPAATIAVVAGLAVVGGREEGGADEEAATGGARTAVERAQPEAAQDLPGQELAQAPPPSRNRAQDYRAELTVRVDDLNGTTSRTMRITRSLGGYIVRADLDSPEVGDGTSRLVVRVPVNRVQEAIVRFSALGELLAQQITIADLQRDLDRREDRIEALRGTIAILERRLSTEPLTDEQRAELARRLENAQRELRAEVRRREEIERLGRLSRIALTLTTREAEEAAEPDGEIESAVRDALGALDDVVAIALYALIVAGPFLLVAIAAVALERRRRRRADERLLERPAA